MRYEYLPLGQRSCFAPLADELTVAAPARGEWARPWASGHHIFTWLSTPSGECWYGLWRVCSSVVLDVVGVDCRLFIFWQTTA